MKHGKLIAALLLALAAGLCAFIKLDDDVVKQVAMQLGKWSADYPQEKVYLQFDKPYYAIGDDIWFKAYITTGAKHQLSGISGILNVELINDKDSVKKALKVAVGAGLAWGDFKLTDSLKEGNYRIRAYTNYMRNAGDDYFFDKTIQIGNSVNNVVFTKAAYTYSTEKSQPKVSASVNFTDFDGKPYAGKEVSYEVQLDFRPVTKGKGVTDDQGGLSFAFVNNMPGLLKSGRIITNLKLDDKHVITKTFPIKAASGKIDVQFFPESGYLVNGIRSKVAFKAVGADGLGVDVKGTVVDNQDKELIQFTSQHLGMGYFILTPESGKTYTARLTYPDGSTGTMALPAANDKGYVLTIYNNDPDNVTVRVSLNQATLQENQNNEINLVTQAGGTILFAAKTRLESTVFTTKIPKSRFPSGIVQFTLFSAKGEPLNERIVLIQNPDLLNLNLSTAKTAYAPREMVKLDINAQDKDNKPVTGAFSVAVIDESKVQPDVYTESNILASILLTSDIKGYIEKPNYYFNNVSDKTRADLDVLMLTQGYRRFSWKQIMADQFPPLAFSPEKTLSITGHVKTPGGKAVPNAKVNLFTTKGGIFYLDTVSDDKGNFIFKNLVFTDSIRFVIQARTAKDRKNVEIELDNVSPQTVIKNKNAADIEVNVNSQMASYLQNSKKQYDDFLKYGLISKTTMMKEVAITDKKQPIKHSDNLNGAGNADQVIKSDQLETCVTLEQCLAGRLLGVIWKNGIPYSTRSQNIPMGLILDGIQMDPDFFSNINVQDIETIEVLRTSGYTAIYGSQAAGGAMVITTKRGDSNTAYQRYAPGIITYNPIGYYRARQFYSPQYDDPKTNTRVADLRTTIFWKPNIITYKNGKASVSFFNADSKGTYRAVIEGMDSDGNIGRTVYSYKIQ